MATVVCVGWVQSPTGCWHHGTVYAATNGLRTDCGMRADPRMWWLDSIESVPPEGERVCMRCAKFWQEGA
jgi:hypothetical protein